MKPSRIETLIYKMLTTNTGTHMCDSGGENGRAWQRNQKRTIDDFIREDEASVEISIYQDKEAYANSHVSLFHYLVKSLSIDALCATFNRKKVSDWNGYPYGVSAKGHEWLMKYFTYEGESWNSYNWDCPLSQTVQGINLIHSETEEKYVLLQIHNGADVRGGYTDAKLFKVDVDCFMLIDLSTDHFELSDNEWIDHDVGEIMDNDKKMALARSLGATNDKSIEIPAYVRGF